MTTTAGQMERLHEHLHRLRLFKGGERLEALLQEATTKELSYADFLDQLLSEEITSKTAKHITMRTSLARFPFVKGLDAFDFSISHPWTRSRSRRWPPGISSSMAKT